MPCVCRPHIIFSTLFTLMMATMWPLFMRSIFERCPGWMRQGYSTITEQTLLQMIPMEENIGNSPKNSPRKFKLKNKWEAD